MTRFPSFTALRAACLDLPPGDAAAAASAADRNAALTKPMGSLGRLEELAQRQYHAGLKALRNDPLVIGELPFDKSRND